MSSTTPLVFRPSPGQRGMAALLFVGSWLVGVRSLVALIHALPRIRWGLQAAALAGEPTTWLWVQGVLVVVMCVVAGGVLVASLVTMLLVEGTQVLVDELGVSVLHGNIPLPLARRLGAGRLGWKRISRLDRKGPFFVIRGGGETPAPDLVKDPDLKFLLVEELERLVLVILERSPNLRFKE